MADRRALDRAARELGYANYEQWAAWDQRTRQVVTAENPAVAGAGQPANWFQNLIGKIGWHPAATLGYVDRKMKGARKK